MGEPMQRLSSSDGGNDTASCVGMNRSVSPRAALPPPSATTSDGVSWESFKHRHSSMHLLKRLSSRSIQCHDDDSSIPPTMPLGCAKFVFEREKRRSVLGCFVPPRASSDLDQLLQTCSSAGLLNNGSLHRVEEKKGVTFTTVEIRSFPMIVGDHPGGIKGVPVTLGWDYLDAVVVDLDQYENIHGPDRRTMQQMRMGIAHREKLLRSLGFSRQEILAGLKSANLVRNSRRKSNELQNLDAIHELLEAMSRKIRNIATLGRRKRREKALILHCVPQGVAIAAKQGSGWSSLTSRTDDLDNSISSTGKSNPRSILRVRGNASLDPLLQGLPIPGSG